jgi:hypothetical protein
MRIVRALSVVLSLSLSSIALASDPAPVKAGETTRSAVACEHGVKKTVCTRCNPKLEAVFKAKGDWCPEHARPESQCALCHPDLAKKGVK